MEARRIQDQRRSLEDNLDVEVTKRCQNVPDPFLLVTGGSRVDSLLVDILVIILVISNVLTLAVFVDRLRERLRLRKEGGALPVANHESGNCEKE